MALQLRRHGIQGVRPLLGGYQAWKDLGFPVETVYPEDEVPSAEESIATDGAA